MDHFLNDVFSKKKLHTACFEDICLRLTSFITDSVHRTEYLKNKTLGKQNEKYQPKTRSAHYKSDLMIITERQRISPEKKKIKIYIAE